MMTREGPKNTDYIENYKNLANAIIRQATDDYRNILRALHKNPNDRSSQEKRESLERFFKSRFYSVLTTIDGDALIQMIQVDEEVNGYKKLPKSGHKRDIEITGRNYHGRKKDARICH